MGAPAVGVPALLSSFPSESLADGEQLSAVKVAESAGLKTCAEIPHSAIGPSESLAKPQAEELDWVEVRTRAPATLGH